MLAANTTRRKRYYRLQSIERDGIRYWVEEDAKRQMIDKSTVFYSFHAQ